MRICKQCGCEFIPTSPRQLYCKQSRIGKCSVCGKEVHYKCGERVPCCSKECINKSSHIKKYTVVCQACGDTFLTDRPSNKYCHKERQDPCPVCGKFVTHICDGKQVTCCSEECRTKYKALRQAKERKLKVFTHTCALCGKQYTDNRRTSANCICSDTHYFNCVVCGTRFVVNSVDHSLTCSKHCRYKYGAQQYKKNSQEWVHKRQQTCLKKYGVTSFSKTHEFKDKVQQTSIKRYGVANYTQTSEYINKAINTNREKYGVDWHTQTEEHKKSVLATNIKKYGSDNVSRSKYFLSKIMTDPSKVDNLIAFRTDPEKFIHEHFDAKPTLTDLSNVCGIVESSIGYIINTRNLNDIVAYRFSRVEDDIYQFLSSILCKDVQIKRNTYEVLKHLELDLYIPDKHFAIEVNPTYTHNSTTGIRGDDVGKPINYHLNKSMMCKEKGIFLFHVFGYDWTWKPEIVKSMIANCLGCTKDKIYARRTEVREVSYKDSKSFLDTNHRQGNCTSSIRLGLYYNNELVSIMTFCKMRNSMGQGKEDLSDCMELARFCSKINTSVVGGASKLFSYFVKHYSVNRVRSFSDVARTKGNLYEKLGFVKVHVNGPSYRWVYPPTDESLSRVSCQKRHLAKVLKDDNLDMSKTEIEIMEQHGYVRVYDCGTVLWEWNRYQGV